MCTVIAGIIADLNEKKNVAVEKAYKQVNKDFSSIFSTLLPGATAKLCPPDGATCLEGLEVKVGFGDVWKESLSELSGGQRLSIAPLAKTRYCMLYNTVYKCDLPTDRSSRCL